MLGPAPHIAVPHPGPRSREVIERVRSTEAAAGLTFGLAEVPPVFARAEGCVIEDPDGNRFLDMVAGFGSLNLGHSHPALVEAVTRQVVDGQQAMSMVSTVRTELIGALSQLVPGLPMVMLGASGSEAAETALKLARRATGKPGVLAFSGGFHGRTMGALALMGRAGQRSGLGQLGPVIHLPYPHAFRSPFGSDPTTVSEITLELIDSQLSDPAGGWDQIGLVMMEPVQGNGGMIPAPAGFMAGLRRICDGHDLVLVSDEVMSGFHRTGRRFAFEHDEGVIPDMVVMGKSLSAGLPLSGVLVSREIAQANPAGTESSTYAGNLVSCASALAAHRVYAEQDMSSVAASRGAHLLSELRSALDGKPHIGEIRGRGLMVAVELVSAGTEPHPVARAVSHACVDRGLLVYPGGHHGNVVAMLPPIVATDDQLSTAVDLLTGVLSSVV
ncbi:MAG: aspartate aminotransferase family protein [Acidimicrobiia bacterium]